MQINARDIKLDFEQNYNAHLFRYIQAMVLFSYISIPAVETSTINNMAMDRDNLYAAVAQELHAQQNPLKDAIHKAVEGIVLISNNAMRTTTSNFKNSLQGQSILAFIRSWLTTLSASHNNIGDEDDDAFFKSLRMRVETLNPNTSSFERDLLTIVSSGSAEYQNKLCNSFRMLLQDILLAKSILA
jgi:hypothetical protein